MLIGDGLKFISALIVPAEDSLKNWCTEQHIPWTTSKEMCDNPRVIALYQSVIDKYNPLFGHIEQIKKFELISDTWQITKPDGSEGELTPTLKLKRRMLKVKYTEVIQSMYED